MANTYDQQSKAEPAKKDSGKSTAKLNVVPPKTGDAVADAKPLANAEDKIREGGAKPARDTSIPLEGEALEKFQKVYDNSAVVRGFFNKDGTKKD